jgi:hypothetical protein
MSENTEVQNVPEGSEVATARPPISPYFAAKVSNLRFAAEGIEKEIQGPQMYNYAKSGLILSNYADHVENDKVKIVFDGDAFTEWLNRTVERIQNGEVVGTADVEKMAELYK